MKFISDDVYHWAASILGSKGGHARAHSLTQAQRKAIGHKAAVASALAKKRRKLERLMQAGYTQSPQSNG